MEGKKWIPAFAGMTALSILSTDCKSYLHKGEKKFVAECIEIPVSLIFSIFDLALCNGMHYTLFVIESFRHDGLEELYHEGHSKRIRPDLKKRINYLLDMLEAATTPEDLRSTPGIHLHRLKGDRKSRWAVSVNGPWRITFDFERGKALDVDLEQYH